MTGDSTRTRGLVDTNVIIQVGLLDPTTLPDDVVISTITLAELSAGSHHASHPVERARRTSVLQHAEAIFDPVPFDTSAARAFGQICAAVLAAGRKPRGRLADLMIASIAHANGLPLHTANPDDFVGLDDLVTVIPVRYAV